MAREYIKIKGYPYIACSDGYVVNIKTGYILKPNLKKSGYQEIVLRDKKGQPHSMLIHRVIASCFCEKKKGADEVNHIDGDKTNNRADNLEWVTRNENLKHAFDNGLRADDVSARGVIATNMENGEEMDFPSIYKASRFFRISQGNICMCCKGLRPHAGGYFWRYKEDR